MDSGVTGSMTALIVLLSAGLLLVGAEIFVPGAVVGTMGVLCLMGAAWVAFTIGTTLGTYVSVGIVLLLAITMVLWIKFFPRSSIGRKMTLSQDGQTFKAAEPKEALLGKTGVAQTELRPAGYALIDGRRVDVVTEGGLVPKGAALRVTQVEGNRVIVRKAEEAT